MAEDEYVPVPNHRFLSGLVQTLMGILPDRFEHSITGLVLVKAGLVGKWPEKVLVKQRREDSVEHCPVGFVRLKRTDRPGRSLCEAVGEDGQSAKHGALGRGEQAVTPVERGAERALPF